MKSSIVIRGVPSNDHQPGARGPHKLKETPTVCIHRFLTDRQAEEEHRNRSQRRGLGLPRLISCLSDYEAPELYSRFGELKPLGRPAKIVLRLSGPPLPLADHSDCGTPSNPTFNDAWRSPLISTVFSKSDNTTV